MSFTSSDFFPPPCTLEVGEVVPEILTLPLQLHFISNSLRRERIGECPSVNCCTCHLKWVKVDCLLSFWRSHWAKFKLCARLTMLNMFQWWKTTNSETYSPLLSFPIKPCWELTLLKNSLLQIACLPTPRHFSTTIKFITDLLSLDNHKPSNNQFSQDREIHPSIQQDVATAVLVRV